jgi:hypothetical protein
MFEKGQWEQTAHGLAIPWLTLRLRSATGTAFKGAMFLNHRTEGTSTRSKFLTRPFKLNLAETSSSPLKWKGCWWSIYYSWKGVNSV